ncbi:MAG: hypothetical protein G01um10147_35 [Microgenomates group bacterium Gr01-1014_7]|nr:MAG: hypothetical protein G01um10147_35 [Microgenomates group bacterium Gr01-1014_7]
MLLKLSKNFLFIFSILLISLFTLYPSFNLALFGDDWLVIYRYVSDVGSISAGFSKHLHEYLSPYGPTQVFMGILEQLYNYNSTFYYITSYLLRLFAAFSLFPITFYLTRNKLSAFFAVLFFSVTTTGFDTTNWVFNMTSYLAIGFISLFLFFYLRSKEEERTIFLVPAIILFYLAYITSSIRMHATLPLLILLEIIWNFQERNLIFARKSLVRLTLVVVTILFIRFTGASFGQPTEAADRFREGISTAKLFLNQGRYDFLAYPLASFGSIFIPDAILPFSGQVSSIKNLIINMVLPILLIFVIVSRFLMKLTYDLKRDFFGILFALTIVWTIIAIIFYKGNISTFSSAAYNSLLLIGGYIFILGLMLIIKNIKLKSTSTLLILSLAWILLSYLYAWWWKPESLYLTTHRYLIVGAAGAAIFLSGLISLGKSKRNQITIFMMFVPLLIIHIYSTRMYENQLISSGHGQEIFNKIWASIPYIPEISKKEKASIFYFEGDGTNGSILHDSITFGFSPHMALLYNITESNKIPQAMDSWEDVVSAVNDGKILKKYGIAKDPIPIDNVYAFKLEGKDHLINLTTQAREKLLKVP